jgi:hypothetical protein
MFELDEGVGMVLLPSLAIICVPVGLSKSERSIAWLLWHG